jgi:enoyl-CoA hydratase/carnithine racemase
MKRGDFLVQKDDRIATVIVNRPERRNAFSIAMWMELTEIIKELDGDPRLRVIVITGTGDEAFASGADIKEMAHNYQSIVDGKMVHPARTATAVVEGATKPVIGMVNGYAIGGGCELAIACDLRVAADTARFGIPSAKLGICIARNEISMLVELVGPSKAKDILFTGRMLSAEEALSIGLVDYVVPREELQEFTMGVARAISENAPLSVLYAKTTIRELKAPHDTDVPHDDSYYSRLCFASQDFQEGVRSFLEKRKPQFKGS